MKHVKHLKGSWFIAAVLISLAMASCYKFARIFAPKEVAPNTPYEGRIVCVTDGNNGEQTGFSVFAVRVPRNWDVTVGDSAYQQYAREGLKNSLDEEVNMAAPMVYSHVLSELYNESNPLEGFEWMAFRTVHANRRSIQGSDAGGCDSICFNFTVLNDGVAGSFTLDYIIGSIESNDDDPSVIDNYAGRLSDAEGSDLFRVSTEQVKVKPGDGEFNTVAPEFKTTVVVLEGGTPVTHDPLLSLSSESVNVGEAVSIKYANLPQAATIEIYKQASLLAMQSSYTVEGDSRHNSGHFDAGIFEPGCYHVRALRSNGTLIDGCAEAVFTVCGYTDRALAAPAKLMVISEPALLTPAPTNTVGKAYEASRGLTAFLFMESSEIIKAIVDSALAYRPAALLVAGGLTKNGEKEGHELLATLLKPLTEAGIKVCVVPGTQDINNPDACSFQGDDVIPTASVSPSEFATIYASLGYADAVSKDGDGLSYLSYLTDDLAVLAIDTHEGFLTPQTVEWMKQAAATAHSTGRHVVALMYHLVGAPFSGYDTLGTLVKKPEEAGLLASILGDSTAVVDPVYYELATADIQDALVSCGISAVFTGDLAASDIACLTAPDGTSFWQIATGGVTSFDCPWRLVGIKDNGLEIETHLTTNLPEREGMSFEDYAYYRTKYRLSEYVDSFCVQNWDLIDAFLQKNFTFEVTEDLNINLFFTLPSNPQQMAALVNSTIVPPLTKLLTTFAEGNENLKKSQQLLDEFHAGVDGILNGLNTLPDIITPMLKEGFAEAGLDLDYTVEAVVGSMVFNYAGTPDNVTNDLFLFVPYATDDLSGIRRLLTDEKEEIIYNLSGQRILRPSGRGIIISNGEKKLVK